jgi:peptidoglycan/LPS O-acetylase OafA/YrhL
VIAPLTGVRLVAAVWVVLFHVYLANGDWLGAEHPVVDALVGPVASQGDLGVDLFFLLSGFVLAHNYLASLGTGPSVREVASFLWLRLSRVWPLYMVAILGGGLLLWLRLQWWGTAPNVPLSLGRLVEQVVMVQQWSAPNVPDTSWTGPAWSISAEWLAYLAFPALAVVVWQVRRRVGRSGSGMLAVLVLVPTLVWTTATQTQAAPYMWLGRLASEFTCGMLLSAALPAGLPDVRRSSSWLAPVALAAIGGWLYVVALVDRPWLGPVVLVLFPPLVLGLALGHGTLHRCLGSRPMVVGGGASFALYLVHVPLLKLFRDALEHGVVPIDPRHQLYGELVVVVGSLGLAYLLFRHVEEPARQRLRAWDPSSAARAETRLRQDSNLRHLVPETSALSPELRRPSPEIGPGRDGEDYRSILVRRKPAPPIPLAGDSRPALRQPGRRALRSRRPG